MQHPYNASGSGALRPNTKRKRLTAAAELPAARKKKIDSGSGTLRPKKQKKMTAAAELPAPKEKRIDSGSGAINPLT